MNNRDKLIEIVLSQNHIINFLKDYKSKKTIYNPDDLVEIILSY